MLVGDNADVDNCVDVDDDVAAIKSLNLEVELRDNSILLSSRRPFLVMILIIPPIASAPYRTDCEPFKTSTC